MSSPTSAVITIEADKTLPQAAKTIWIDLDNSPHVPFFVPIIEALRAREHAVLVTARDCFQVRELADLRGLKYTMVGSHYGRHFVWKVLGLCVRAAQLGPVVRRAKPDLALSHGSRSQLILSAALRLQSMVICDYEFAKGLRFLNPTWMMYPEVIAGNRAGTRRDTLSYPGIKEDVYVPRFRPDDSIRELLGLQDEDLVITLRPPATEAHYHNSESEALLAAVCGASAETSGVKVVLLPRNGKQEAEIRKQWPGLFASGRMLVPNRAVDGLNLIWHSDLVISGGGTMNREAAALGVPVYSIFRGPIGAVDRYLASVGKLILIESIDEVSQKIRWQPRHRGSDIHLKDSRTLDAIVRNIEQVLEVSRHRA